MPHRKNMNLRWLVLVIVSTAAIACHPAKPAGSEAAQNSSSAASTTEEVEVSGIEKDAKAQRGRDYGMPAGIRPSYYTCLDTALNGSSDAAHQEGCASDEWQYQQNRLDDTIASVKRRLEGEHQRIQYETFVNSQNEWAARLDDACGNEAAIGTSLMGPANFSICLMRNTAKRVHELQRAYLGNR